MKRLLNLLLPNRCVMTGRMVQDSRGLSVEGFSKIQFITEPYCHQCGAPLKFPKEVCKACIHDHFLFQHARSVFVYDYHSKKLILQYKHGDRLSLSPVLGQGMAQYGANALLETDVMVPVPLHPKRLRLRMYNQAAELTKAIGKITDKPYVLEGLIRVKHTHSQGHEDRESRFENMREAFEVNPTFKDKIQGQSIMIVDDVLTTGSTLNACAATLLPFNPKKILVLTLAKVLLK
ncbi:MAG: ComF family protein [Alphaproteobacteria bacterium]|nr:ComF family protein [Alphaproteobacteria bacterium]